MQQDLDCKGKVTLGALSPETSQRLQDFGGNWLEYTPSENAVVVRHVQPVGCPALSAIPCELLHILGSIPATQRDAIPGGTLYLKDRHGEVMRLLVKNGEVRIQWPHPDYERATSVSPDKVMNMVNGAEAKINGWVKFEGAAEKMKELQDCLDRFEGLYPEGDMVADCKKNHVSITFTDVNMGPKELVAKLTALTDDPKSLQAELDVTSFVPESEALDFRLYIHNGSIKTMRPSLWGNE